MLDHIPALQDQMGSDSIHFAGIMMFVLELHHARNGRPPPSAFASRCKKSLAKRDFCKRLMSESVPGEAVIGLVGFFFAAGIAGAALVAGLKAWLLARSEVGRCHNRQA